MIDDNDKGSVWNLIALISDLSRVIATSYKRTVDKTDAQFISLLYISCSYSSLVCVIEHDHYTISSARSTNPHCHWIFKRMQADSFTKRFVIYIHNYLMAFRSKIITIKHKLGKVSGAHAAPNFLLAMPF